MALGSVEIARIGRGMNLSSIFSNVSGKIEFNEGTNRINQSMGLIFEVSNGEVAMLPVVGSSIYEMLFEPADDILKDKLELFVRDALERLEPRASIQNLIIDVVESYVYITVDYILTGTNIAGNFNYELTRQSGGDVY